MDHGTATASSILALGESPLDQLLTPLSPARPILEQPLTPEFGDLSSIPLGYLDSTSEGPLSSTCSRYVSDGAPGGLTLVGLEESQFSDKYRLHPMLANGNTVPQVNLNQLDMNSCMCTSLVFALYLHYLGEEFPSDEDDLRALGQEVLLMGANLYYEHAFLQVLTLSLPNILDKFIGMMSKRFTMMSISGGRADAEILQTECVKALFDDFLRIMGALLIGYTDMPKHLDFHLIRRGFDRLVQFQSLEKMYFLESTDVVNRTQAKGLMHLNHDMVVVPHTRLAHVFRRFNLGRALMCNEPTDRLVASIAEQELHFSRVRESMDQARPWACLETVQRELDSINITDPELRLIMDEELLSDEEFYALIERIYRMDFASISSRLFEVAEFPVPSRPTIAVDMMEKVFASLRWKFATMPNKEAGWLLLQVRAMGIAALKIHGIHHRGRAFLRVAHPSLYEILGSQSLPAPWNAGLSVKLSLMESRVAAAKQMHMPLCFVGSRGGVQHKLCAPLDTHSVLTLLQTEAESRNQMTACMWTVDERSFLTACSPSSEAGPHRGKMWFFDSHQVGIGSDAVIGYANTTDDLLKLVQGHYDLEHRIAVEVTMFCVAKELDTITKYIVQQQSEQQMMMGDSNYQ